MGLTLGTRIVNAREKSFGMFRHSSSGKRSDAGIQIYELGVRRQAVGRSSSGCQNSCDGWKNFPEFSAKGETVSLQLVQKCESFPGAGQPLVPEQVAMSLLDVEARAFFPQAMSSPLLDSCRAGHATT